MKNSLATLATAPSRVSSGASLASGSRVVACAAVWCGVHCALTPFLVAAAPALALSEGVERAVWAGTFVLGAVMLALGPARRNAAVLLIFAGGTALWFASLAGWLEPLPETGTSTAGSLVLAGALFQGARICQAGAGACAVCDEEEPTDQRS
ncbi:MAG: MerC family mercury resistance protein [Gemmatimonadales bacterium]|nr:MerC family mercury resistance protein [Gemmatimonadales bacterium]